MDTVPPSDAPTLLTVNGQSIPLTQRRRTIRRSHFTMSETSYEMMDKQTFIHFLRRRGVTDEEAHEMWTRLSSSQDAHRGPEGRIRVRMPTITYVEQEHGTLRITRRRP